MKHFRFFPWALAVSAVVAGGMWGAGWLTGVQLDSVRWDRQAAVAGAAVVAEPGPAEPGPAGLVQGRPLSPSGRLAAAVSDLAGGHGALAAARFADPATAAEFAAKWAGRLPVGEVLVAKADQVDAGAAAGHLVPVELWVSGPDAVAGLVGKARLTPSPGEQKILDLQLEPISLSVSTWSAAADRLATPGARRSALPFFGRFRFQGDGLRWAVDARFGSVEDE